MKPRSWKSIRDMSGGFPRRLSTWFEWVREGGDPLGSGLTLCAVILTVWLAVEAVLPESAPAPLPEVSESQRGTGPPADSEEGRLRSYVGVITGRPVFGHPEPRTAASAPESRARRAVPVSSRAADLELAGIIGGEVREAIIRNRKSGEIYYVSVGQAVGEMIVKEIGPRSVVLEAGGEEIILGL